MNEFANVTVSTLGFATDGRGAVSAIRGSASTAGTTTYTTNTAVDGTAWTLTTVAAGDYAFTADGFWGIVQSKDTNTITVDRWRKAGHPEGGKLWTPAAAGACTVHSPTHIAGSPWVVLKQIIMLKGGTDTFAITDQKGVNLTNFVFTGAAGAPAVIADYGDGIPFAHPIGFKASGTANAWQVIYDSSGIGPRG